MNTTMNQADEKPKKKRVKQPPSAFNLRLRTERMRAGLSQVKLGKLTGVHSVTINCLETGRAQYPTWNVYKKLAASLPGIAGSIDETKLPGWYPADGMRGSGITHKPQVRLLKAVAGLASKGVLVDVQELLDAAHAEGVTVPELLSVVTAT